MAQKYRTAKRITLAVFLILFSFIIISAFIDSWKTGSLWFIAALFLFIIFRSYNSSSSKRLSLFVKIPLVIMFIVFFGWGGTYLPKSSKNNEIAEQQDTNEPVTDEPIQLEKEIKIDSLKLNKIQETWATKIIREWQGSYIESFNISQKENIIYFQLTEEASRGNWNIDAELHQSIFQDKVDSLLTANFNEDEIIPETKIVIIPNEKQVKINAAKAQRQELIARQFSLWNGANRYLQDYIKDNMNDPDCYEHISTNYSDEGDYIIVNTKIRGCNAFGAKIIQVISAKIDLKGNILSIN